MACSMATKVACVVVMCMVVGGSIADAAITCGEVASKLQSCIGYLTGSGGMVPAGCCNGVKALNAEAKTTPDRQQACKCLKSTASAIPGLKYNLAAGLPGKCGVSIPYTISPNVDCSKVK